MSGRYDYDRDRRAGGGYGRRDYEDHLDQRLAEANQKMEDSSFRCVRTLHETMQIANDTSEELERQSESLDRTEDNLDRMAIDLESSKRNMREVKSVFGSLVNRFSKPKIDKDPAPSKSSRSTMPPSPPKQKKQAQQAQAVKSSTGNATVDRNLDELEAGLKMLEGQAYLMGSQIDESNDQIDRIRVKLDRNDQKLKKVTRDAKRQL
ncbi:PREDICTED: soluble NSF attachment protein 29-like [Amphimedon queenslandica]|uniref:t-SNARE coiled-coil homology domain-containing protein n=1 Tax=Amphimedon queenslandica TaxID=400682 RepID=A0A1X7VJ94_AMPQE|nr:PREDICTED: soluble NSF attachment protein 29-like [Amphimedon queenslandica]|eukprot:XP_003384143.1 PREDICTED: soluble NSF attachment protein 29-like [Amphimedon queenslandica]